MQIRAAFVANSAAIHLGLMFSFSAMALPEMMAPDSSIKINTDEASWIGKKRDPPEKWLLFSRLTEQFLEQHKK